MAEVVAKHRHGNKSFEILVDMEKAIDFKQDKTNDIKGVLAIDTIFSDSKKGEKASEDDMQTVFETKDIYEVAAKIIKRGIIQLTAEYRKKLREAKEKQIIDYLSKNCINPQTNLPHPPQRIENAIEEAGAKIDEFKPVEEQVGDIIDSIQEVLPIKIEVKKLAIKIPAAYTGKAYSILKDYLKKEEYQNDGSLVVVVELPAGLQMEFFDKLNSLTQGSAETKEIKD